MICQYTKSTRYCYIAHLDGAKHAVRTKLFEEESRALGHGFVRSVGPGLHTEHLRRSAFVAQLFPYRVEANQINGRKYEGCLTLQVA